MSNFKREIKKHFPSQAIAKCSLGRLKWVFCCPPTPKYTRMKYKKKNYLSLAHKETVSRSLDCLFLFFFVNFFFCFANAKNRMLTWSCFFFFLYVNAILCDCGHQKLIDIHVPMLYRWTWRFCRHLIKNRIKPSHWWTNDCNQKGNSFHNCVLWGRFLSAFFPPWKLHNLKREIFAAFCWFKRPSCGLIFIVFLFFCND